MGTLIGIAAMFAALILIGVIFGIIEQRKIRRGRRAGERPSASRTSARLVVSQRVPTVSDALRGGPRPCPDGRSSSRHSRSSRVSRRR